MNNYLIVLILKFHSTTNDSYVTINMYEVDHVLKPIRVCLVKLTKITVTFNLWWEHWKTIYKVVESQHEE